MSRTDIITKVNLNTSEKITHVKDGWDSVLVDAEQGLHDAQKRVRQLKKAIKTIRVKIAANETFPVIPNSSTHN